MISVTSPHRNFRGSLSSTVVRVVDLDKAAYLN